MVHRSQPHTTNITTLSKADDKIFKIHMIGGLKKEVDPL